MKEGLQSKPLFSQFFCQFAEFAPVVCVHPGIYISKFHHIQPVLIGGNFIKGLYKIEEFIPLLLKEVNGGAVKLKIIRNLAIGFLGLPCEEIFGLCQGSLFSWIS